MTYNLQDGTGHVLIDSMHVTTRDLTVTKVLHQFHLLGSEKLQPVPQLLLAFKQVRDNLFLARIVYWMALMACCSGTVLLRAGILTLSLLHIMQLVLLRADTLIIITELVIRYAGVGLIWLEYQIRGFMMSTGRGILMLYRRMLISSCGDLMIYSWESGYTGVSLIWLGYQIR